jgi:AraC-like DNA-binding protein
VTEQPARITRLDVSSADPEVADAWLQDTYVDYRRRLHGDPAEFTFTFTGAVAPGFSIATLHHAIGFEARTGTVDDALIVNTTLGGRIEVATDRTTVVPEVGTPYLMPPDGSWRVRWDDLTNEAVRLERAVLDRTAADLGWEGGTVRFAGAVPASPERARYLRATIEHVRDDVLARDDHEGADLLLGEAARSLALATLVTFPNDVFGTLEAGGTAGTAAEPAVIRRAVAFVDANAHRDIGVAEIAEAARLGVRGLQVAFRRHRDQTPLEYLRQVRMEQARRELEGAEPGTTVAEVAARWGFSHPGRFAAEYRRLFGRHPSEALRR